MTVVNNTSRGGGASEDRNNGKENQWGSVGAEHASLSREVKGSPC